jgi:uncharacterized protein (TIGR00725 family)
MKNYLFQERKEGNKTAIELRFTICVSGAAQGATLATSTDEAAALGREIAKRGHIVTTGATVGLPEAAAEAAKQAGGMVVGFSPAGSLREHLRKYRLPYSNYDFLNFTGMEYVGRDLYLIQSSDAVVTVGGRFGSLHEFTSAIEAHKPCGILISSGGTADIIPQLMEILEPPKRSLVVYDTDPAKLVAKIEAILKEKLDDLKDEFTKDDQFWYQKKGTKKG